MSKGTPTPKAPQNQQKLAVPQTYIQAFTAEMDFGVVKREQTGNLPLFRCDYGIPGGGIIRIEWPAGFTPQVIESMTAAFGEWAESEEGQEAVRRAKLAGRGVAVIEGLQTPDTNGES